MPQLPANYGHCHAVYDYMAERSTDEKTDEYGTIVVWTGFTTKIFEYLSLPTPYYTSITHKLMAMGCVQQLNRGGGGSPSKWWLITPPTEDLYTNSPDKLHGKPSKNDADEQRHRDILAYVQSLEHRITTLEDRING